MYIFEVHEFKQYRDISAELQCARKITVISTGVEVMGTTNALWLASGLY